MNNEHNLAILRLCKPPQLLASDRKLATAANEGYAEQQYVKQVVLPRSGAKSARRMAHERQR